MTEGALGFGAIEIEGLPELYKALGQLDVSIQKELKAGLIEGAEPVSKSAEELVKEPPPAGIRNMTEHWARMKVGVTGQALVYIAPFSRRTGRGSRRPNLAGLLLERMETAAEHGEPLIEAKVEAAVGRAISEAGF